MYPREGRISRFWAVFFAAMVLTKAIRRSDVKICCGVLGVGKTDVTLALWRRLRKLLPMRVVSVESFR